MSLWKACKAFFAALCNKPTEVAVQPPAPTKKDDSHLRLLSVLQSSGRLVDFLQEDISECSDEQIGAAVRLIHADCAKTLEEFITVRPLMDQEEGSEVTLAAGYDASSIKLVGNVKGTYPVKGRILHRGWKAHKLSLPKAMHEGSSILAQAEVEVR